MEQEVVAQAAGMVSVQAECSIDEASAMLRERAESTAQSVQLVAKAVVERRARFAPRSTS